MKKPTVRVSMTDIYLTKAERSQLQNQILPLLPPLPAATIGAVMNEIEEAVARAKPSIDYAKTAARLAKLESSARRAEIRRTVYKRPPTKDWWNAIGRLVTNLKPTWHLKIAPRREGRSHNVIADLLMKDLIDICKRHSIQHGWKKGSHSQLAKTFDVCASMAGLHVPGDAFGIWQNATSHVWNKVTVGIWRDATSRTWKNVTLDMWKKVWQSVHSSGP